MSPTTHLRPALLGIAVGVAVFAIVPAARADLGLSISLERAAGLAYANARPTNSSESFGITSFSIAGPALNPVAAPRVGVDVILPIGLTLGGAVAYDYVALSNNPDNGSSSTETGHAWLLSPRVGYRIAAGEIIDITPRVGITLASATLNQPDYTCGVGGTTCPGDSSSIFFGALSLDVPVALRLTRSFNLLGGVAYDHVFTASGSSESGPANARQSSDAHASGRYLGIQLWFGLGGYVL